MTSQPNYTQEICKLSQSSTRLKEQVAGRLLHYWKEDLKGGKSNICAVFLDGQTFQNVLTAEAWSDADQAHAEKHLKPLLRQVVALENGEIASKRGNLSVPRAATQIVANNDETIEAIANLATATTEDRRAVANLTETVKILSDQIASLNAKLIQAVEKNHSLLASMAEKRATNRFKYCWTCGTHCDHGSKDCRSPKEGHQKDATYNNRMNGNNKKYRSSE